nr:cyd operon protein YbgE [Vibrio sp. 99-8-1]
MIDQVVKAHQPIENSALLRALIFVLAIGHAGLVMWEPTLYAQAIGGFNAVIAPLLIWSVCTGVIVGIGFVPRAWFWKLFFSPYLSFAVLCYLTIRYVWV